MRLATNSCSRSFGSCSVTESISLCLGKCPCNFVIHDPLATKKFNCTIYVVVVSALALTNAHRCEELLLCVPHHRLNVSSADVDAIAGKRSLHLIHHGPHVSAVLGSAWCVLRRYLEVLTVPLGAQDELRANWPSRLADCLCFPRLRAEAGLGNRYVIELLEVALVNLVECDSEAVCILRRDDVDVLRLHGDALDALVVVREGIRVCLSCDTLSVFEKGLLIRLKERTASEAVEHTHEPKVHGQGIEVSTQVLIEALTDLRTKYERAIDDGVSGLAASNLDPNVLEDGVVPQLTDGHLAGQELRDLIVSHRPLHGVVCAERSHHARALVPCPLLQELTSLLPVLILDVCKLGVLADGHTV